jgi:hypothetical protein
MHVESVEIVVSCLSMQEPDDTSSNHHHRIHCPRHQQHPACCTALNHFDRAHGAPESPNGASGKSKSCGSSVASEHPAGDFSAEAAPGRSVQVASPFPWTRAGRVDSDIVNNSAHCTSPSPDLQVQTDRISNKADSSFWASFWVRAKPTCCH